MCLSPWSCAKWQLHWGFEQQWWTGFGRTVLTNHLCCTHPWKLKVSYKLEDNFALLTACVVTFKPSDRAKKIGNKIWEQHLLCPQHLSSFSPRSLSWKAFQDSNCHWTLVCTMEHNGAAATTWIFSAWSCLCTRELKRIQRAWRWHSTGCGPSSAWESLCDPLLPFWVHQGSVQLDQISLKIGLYSRLGGCIAVQVDRGKKKSAKQRGVLWGIKMLLKILSISSELSFLPMPSPLY